MKISESESSIWKEICRGLCACLCLLMPLLKIFLARFSHHSSVSRETILWGVKWVIWLLSEPTIVPRTYTYLNTIVYVCRDYRYFVSGHHLNPLCVVCCMHLARGSIKMNIGHNANISQSKANIKLRSNVFNTLIQIEMNSLEISRKQTEENIKTHTQTHIHYWISVQAHSMHSNIKSQIFQSLEFYSRFVCSFSCSLSPSFVVAVLVVMLWCDGGWWPIQAGQ